MSASRHLRSRLMLSGGLPVRGDVVATLPPELIEEVLLHADMLSRVAFGQTARRNRGLSCNANRLACGEAVRPYGLTFTDIHFLQHSIGAVVSGSTVTQLLRPVKDFTPGDLDIYCRAMDGYQVARFLGHCTGYYVERRSEEYEEAQGLRFVWWLAHKSPARPPINIIESLTDNALDAVLNFHSTAVMGAWMRPGFWHPYPKSTFTALSLTSPSRMALDRLSSRRRMWLVIKKYMGRGFKLTTEWPLPHVCGWEWNCPVTLRTSEDGGCLRIPFSPRFPIQDLPLAAAEDDASSWTLGPVPCTTGAQMTAMPPMLYYALPRGTTATLPIQAYALTLEFPQLRAGCKGLPPL